MDPNAQPDDGPSVEEVALALGYLEFLMARKATITLETADGVEAEGRIASLDRAKGRLTLAIPNAPSAGLEPNDPVSLFFGLYNCRWMGSAVVLHHREHRRSFVLTLPRRLTPRDRRQSQRVKPEDATAWVQVDEFQGAALQGQILDLSEGGLRFRIDKDGRGAEDPDLEALREGLDLALVRVSGLDGGSFESAGRLVHLRRSGGAVLGLRFRNLKAEARSFQEAFLLPRLGPALSALPPISAEPLIELEPEGPEEAAPGPEAKGGASAGPEPRQDALLRMKKRGRVLLVVMPAGEARQALLARLAEDGFGRVLAAERLSEVNEAFQASPVNLVLILGGIPEMGDLELANFLSFAKGDQLCPILLVARSLDIPFQVEARRAGVRRLLPPGLPGADLHVVLEEELGLRPRGGAAEASAPTGSGARGRLLRRLKGVALVMPEGEARDRVQAFLQGEGFTQVLPAGSVAELTLAARSATLALMFVDWPEGPASVLDLVGFLGSLPRDPHPHLVVASSQVNARFIRDVKALGVDQVVVKPYDLNSAFADLLTRCLEG